MPDTLQNDIFRGKLVRLTAQDAKTNAEHFSRWSRDTELQRLLDSNPARPLSAKAIQNWIEKDIEKGNLHFFSIRTLKDDLLIGDVGLDGIQWTHGDAFMGISLGDREYWGKGFGTDALRLILRYAFHELNLHRVTLSVFEYNPRAIRSYEKVGFVHEGRMRKFLNREGRRWDILFMGITRQEWEKSLVE